MNDILFVIAALVVAGVCLFANEIERANSTRHTRTYRVRNIWGKRL